MIKGMGSSSYCSVLGIGRQSSRLSDCELNMAEELAMDFFSRQRSVPDWQQPLIEQQRALLLGVGGIGCTIAKELCRLGVCELVLVDNDTVSASNVNRQVLFSVRDVGRRKVEAAKETLEHSHNIHTTVSVVDCDAVLEWKKIVELAKKSTVVFNCIDYGEYFDYCVTSLCSSLSLPYVSASSYGHTAIAECYPAVDYPSRGPCWACNNPPAGVEILQRITPRDILQLESLDFLPKDTNMPTNQDIGSSILPCTLAATMATGAWINSCHGYTVPNWMSCDFATFQLFSYPSEPNPGCLVCKNAPRYSPQLLSIFFGSESVRLSVVGGETLPYVSGSITSPGGQLHYQEARNRFKPGAGGMEGLGEEYANCVVPAIPAAQLEIRSTFEEGEMEGIPEQLRTPLLKTADGQLHALRSGGRSCILPTTQACYRLKGCGNYVDAEGMRYPYPGLPLLKYETPEAPVEIRGCCFKHTALTEQHMSTIVSDILKKFTIPVGNRPVGIWHYQQLLGEPLPRVAKYCGLFETLGEKRVGSHLLPGLESLLPLLFPSVSLDQVLSLCPAQRLAAADTNTSVLELMPTWKACCAGTDKMQPIDMCLTPLPETGPTSVEGIPSDLLGAWCQASYTLRQSLPLSQDNALSFGSLTALLYWTVGWEMGVVKRALEAAGVNWGYFFDHNPFEPHCNSHPNNFLVLPPGHASLVAPVDFDLSFQREHFFSPYTGSYDQDLFDSWMESEHLELERALAGETANTGMDMITTADAKNLSPTHQALGWAFRDTMLLGYRCAYSQGEPTNIHPLPPSLKTAIDALIRLALIKTVNCIT